MSKGLLNKREKTENDVDKKHEQLVVPDADKIHKTADYGKFSYIHSNRSISKEHIQRLINSFEKHPNLVATRPILVNEKMEVIDGQHRLQACGFLRIPVYYTVAKGTNISDAQVMNALQKGWSLLDYARSYALSGRNEYQEFLKLYEEFPLPITILIVYCQGKGTKNSTAAFKNGELQITKNRNHILELLEKLVDTSEYVDFWRTYNYGVVMLKVLQNPDYDHEHFLRKLKAVPLERAASQEDMIRNIEYHYNHKMSEDKRIRLF